MHIYISKNSTIMAPCQEWHGPNGAKLEVNPSFHLHWTRGCSEMSPTLTESAAAETLSVKRTAVSAKL